MLEIHHQELSDADSPGDSREGSHFQAIARANMSLSLNALLWVILALALFTLGMAGYLTFFGYWPILVIAATQVIAVSWALFYAWRMTWAVEIIELRGHQLIVTRHLPKDSSKTVLDAHWARVEVVKTAWRQRELRVSSCGDQVILGRFLGQTERMELAGYLRSALAAESAWTRHQ